MRVLRKIADCSRFGSGCASDLEVRQMLGAPSIECLLLRRRLTHALSLTLHAPPSLIALLQARVGVRQDKYLPWTVQVRNDLAFLQSYHSPKLDALGCPTAQAKTWAEFMKAFPEEWKELVAAVSFCGAMLPVAPNTPPPGHNAGTFFCELCVERPVCFKTRKGLEAHLRTKHAKTTGLDCYVDDSGVCPVCNQNFHTRLRVLHHVREKRVRARTKRLLCRDALLSGAFLVVSSTKLVQLRKRDNELLCERRKLGKSKVRVNTHA